MKPISYLQTDKRWSGISYSAPGESTTIGKAGCGPTSAAMVIASLKDPSVTPATTAKWSLAHGYKALKQGTYYSYFVPQLKAYGIQSRQMNQINNYHHNDQEKLRASVRAHLTAGGWIIACMGKGTWTSSGHFILAYGVDDSGKVLINDPASTASHRTRGDMKTFLSEAKYFWLIETAPDQGDDNKGDLQMTEEQIKQLISEAENRAVEKAVSAFREILLGEGTTEPEWAKREFNEAIEAGITDGTRPGGYATRYEVAMMMARNKGGSE